MKYIIVLGQPKADKWQDGGMSPMQKDLDNIGKRCQQMPVFDTLEEAETHMKKWANHTYWNYEVQEQLANGMIVPLDHEGLNDYQVVVGQPKWEEFDKLGGCVDANYAKQIGEIVHMSGNTKAINLTLEKAKKFLARLHHPLFYYEITHVGVQLKLLPREK